MKLINLDNKQLDDFADGQPHSQFLQCSAWADFNESLGFKIFKLGVEENKQIIASCLIIKKKLFNNFNYFYAPRGPIAVNQGAFNFLILEIKKIAKSENAVFVRVEPTFDFDHIGFKKTLEIQPSQTIILDLTKSEQDLLAGMHPKTRYNIKLAAKKNLQITHGRPTDKEFAEFWSLMQDTKQRDNFGLHAKNYYQKMLELPQMKLWQARHHENLIAAAIIARSGDMATYVHGASANSNRDLMAPYALHWQIIQEAKQQSFKYYDLYGINAAKYPGVTRFKEGWGGEKISYPGTFDLVINSGYYRAYRILRRIRRVI